MPCQLRLGFPAVILASLLLLSAGISGCGSDTEGDPDPDVVDPDVVDPDVVDPDVVDPDVVDPDAERDVADVSDADADVVDPVWEGFPGVRIDLASYRQTEGSGAVAREAGEADLIHGQREMSRVGDFYLANDLIRVIVQGHDRHMGVAPWGGNIIEGDVLREAGEPGRDAFGDLSLLLNFGRTLIPEDFRVLYDGDDGGGAVLAVTGRDTINDFINVPVLLVNNLGTFAGLRLDPEEDLELTISQFYVLNPGEERVRVVTALRNDGEVDRILTMGELVHAGGDNALFNPVRLAAHFGYPSAAVAEAADAYLAWVSDDVSYGYAPRIEGGPTSAMTVSGVTGTIVGAEDLFDFTAEGGPPLDPEDLPPGAVLLAPDEVHVLVRDFYVASDLAGVHAAYHGDSGVELGSLAGTVAVDGGVPAGTRVAAFSTANNRLATVFNVDAEGTFSGRLPVGEYRLRADAPGHPFSADATVEVVAGAEAAASLTAPSTARVTVVVTTPEGDPSPAKVTFVCVGECPRSRSTARNFRDLRRDPLPAGVAHVGFVGVSGEETFAMPPGDYHIVVSRGSEYSVWPHGWPAEPGPVQALTAGETATVEAEIARVIDTQGWISADLHVHGINSPDSFVHHHRRVLAFLAEGVDVLVSTDHDFVTDWAPYVADLGAESHLMTLVGNELTTFDWGHFNTYPVEVNPDSRSGSYLDWGNGEGPTLNPTQLFDAILEIPSPVAEPVIQVNHPRGLLGHFTGIGLDTASFATATDPRLFRMEPPEGSELGVDTRLFDTRFTVMEIYNGWSVPNFITYTNDWFAFLQRGFLVTGVAVSDTHREFSGAVGSPRSWVWVGPDNDTPDTFDLAAFVDSLNAGRSVGGNGPFIRVQAHSGGNSVGPRELLSLADPSDGVTLAMEVEVPAWFGIDRIEVYANIEGTDARPFEEPTTAPEPSFVIEVDLSEEETEAGVSVADDPDSPHRRYVIERVLHLEPSVDTWYVVMVKGSTSGFPVLLEADVTALAFTNPVLVDVDGDGVFEAPAPVENRPVGDVERPLLLETEGPRLSEDELHQLMEALDHHH